MIRWLALAALLIPLVLTAGCVACQVHGLHTVKAEVRAWDAAGMPLEDLPSEYPPRPDSPSAQRLDELARPLGIVLIPEGYGDPLLSLMKSDTTLRSFRDVALALSKNRQDTVEPMPANVSDFLSTHQREVDRVAAYLSQADDLVWKEDIARGFFHPFPALESQYILQSVLIGRALEEPQQDRPQVLEALWRQHQSLSFRADGVSQISAMGLARQQHGLLRCLRHVPSNWEDRVGSYDYPGRLGTEHRLLASLWLLPARDFVSLQEIDGQTDPHQPASDLWIERFVSSGYVRRAATRISRTLRRAAEAARSGGLCTLEGEDAEEGTKGWRRILGPLNGDPHAEIILSSEYDVWKAFQQAVLDAELTRRVLAARRARDTSGHWPSGGTHPSEACEDLIWQEAPQPDGTFSIHAAGTIPPGAGEVADLRFTLSP